tara:strand:+ start:44 stop:505 length:462 start_codon:yes stop_codon:yes gene_type:complete
MRIDHFNYIWQVQIPKDSVLAKLINDKNKKSGICKYDIPENRLFMYGDWYDTKSGNVSTPPVKTKSKTKIITSDHPLNRKRTEEIVFELLNEVITEKSNMTKGGLIKYIRNNFKQKSIYTDVGRVANKLVKLHTGRTGRWKISTTARFIRKAN